MGPGHEQDLVCVTGLVALLVGWSVVPEVTFRECGDLGFCKNKTKQTKQTTPTFWHAPQSDLCLGVVSRCLGTRVLAHSCLSFPSCKVGVLVYFTVKK